MRPRPQDFFGPDDYMGGDWRDDERDIQKAQAEWDREFAALPWWRKLLMRFGL